MPTQLINPHSLIPAEFARDQYLTAYWYLTWMRTIYEPNAGTWLEMLANIAGTEDFEVFEQTEMNDLGEALGIIPRVEVIRIAPSPPLIHVRGSVTNYQIFQQFMDWHFARFDAPVVSAPVMGEDEAISFYNWGRVPRIAEKLGGDDLPVTWPTWFEDGWVGVGHSLGGAMIGVMSLWADPSLIVTAGSPREGNASFAAARPAAVKLRFYNDNDLVPKVPPSTGALSDWLEGSDAISLLSWQHWGQPWVLLQNSPPQVGSNFNWTGPEYFTQFTGHDRRDAIDFEHSTAEYCRRVRNWIQRDFPLDDADVFYPGLFELDTINNLLNEVGESARPELWGGPIQSGPITQIDLWGIFGEFRRPEWWVTDVDAIYPFQCGGPEGL